MKYVVSEEKMTINSVFLVNKNQYTVQSDYYSQTCLVMLKSLLYKLYIMALWLSKSTVT